MLPHARWGRAGRRRRLIGLALFIAIGLESLVSWLVTRRLPRRLAVTTVSVPAAWPRSASCCSTGSPRTYLLVPKIIGGAVEVTVVAVLLGEEVLCPRLDRA